MLDLYDEDKEMVIWACESRNSDSIMIIIGNNEDRDIKCMFSEDAYKRAKYFKCNDYDSAVDFAYKQIRIMFKDKIDMTNHYEFYTSKSLENIRKIQIDQSNLDYEDYYELATFVDKDNNIMSDLIVLDGKMGIRYSALSKDGSIENLDFEQFDPNLENEVTLMLGLKDQTDSFIEKEMIYDMQCKVGI